MKKIIPLLLCFFWTSYGFAEDDLTLSQGNQNPRPIDSDRRFPHGCRQLGYDFQDPLLIIKSNAQSQNQTLFLVHNTAEHDIRLKDDNAPRFAPNYEKVIPANQWAAFSFDTDLVQFSCDRPNETDSKLNCQSVIELCQYNNAKFPEQNFGTYWLEKTGSRDATMEDAIQKGILLRW